MKSKFDIVRRVKRHVNYGVILAVAGVMVSSCRKAEAPVIATVGASKLTEADFRDRLAGAPPEYRQYAASPEGRRQFLDLLIREKVLLEESKAQGVYKDPSYKKALGRYQDEAAKRFREYQDTLQGESVLRKLRSGPLAASDTEVEKYYNEHPEDYQKPVEITASHIMLANEAEAETALARLGTKESFEKVAKSMSKDPATAVRGGKLKPFVKGTFGPDFENAVFPLKVGGISGVVKTRFGFHIIKKLGEKALPARSLAEVKDEIRSKLEKAKFDEWVSTKQATIGVKVNEEAVASLSLEESQKP